MNQIDFIKKWAKKGDRVEDKGKKYIYNGFLWNDQGSPLVNELNEINSEFVHLTNWQSPKIYRLGTTIWFDEGYSEGYKEEWQLIADYADEEKKEEENNGDNTLYEIVAKATSEGRPASNIVFKLASGVEKRLKALEDKIK